MPIKRRGEGGEIEIAPSWDQLVERKIREAQEEGLFENLAGMGKPQDLSDNPYAGDWQMAFKILKDADATPSWIEAGKDVRKQEEETEQILRSSQSFLRSWPKRQGPRLGRQPSQLDTRRCSELRERYRRQYAEHLIELNQKIEDFNLLCPMPWLRRGRIPLEQRLREFDQAFPSLDALP